MNANLEKLNAARERKEHKEKALGWLGLAVLFCFKEAENVFSTPFSLRSLRSLAAKML